MRKLIVTLSSVILLTGCVQENSSFSSISSTTETSLKDTSSSENYSSDALSSSTYANSIEEAISSLRTGFEMDVIVKQSAYCDNEIDQVSNQGVSIAFGKEDGISFFGSTSIVVDETGDYLSPSTKSYVYEDEEGLCYQECVDYTNSVSRAYPLSDYYFDSLYYNPFVLLSPDLLVEDKEGRYIIDSTYVIYLSSYIGLDLPTYRTIENAYLIVYETEVSHIHYSFSDYTYVSSSNTYVYTFDCDIYFTAHGEEVRPAHIQIAEDDGTDKTLLKKAFDSIKDNFTLSFSTSYSENLGYGGSTSYYLYDGNEIYVSTSITDMPKNGDTYFYKESEESQLLVRGRYDEETSSFNENGYFEMNYSPISYAEHMPKYNDISMALLTYEDGIYCVRKEYLTEVFPYLEPYYARRALFSDDATYIRITIDSNNLPIIKMGYLYYEEEYEITISFFDIGITTIDDKVKAMV